MIVESIKSETEVTIIYKKSRIGIDSQAYIAASFTKIPGFEKEVEKRAESYKEKLDAFFNG